MSRHDWAGLTRLVALFRREVDRLPTKLSLHEHAEAIAISVNGEVAVRAHRIYVNIAALAIASRCAPSTWLCRPSASTVIHSTDLLTIPATPPSLFQSPGIVEVRRPETGERLWGDIVSIGWYTVPGADQIPPAAAASIYLLGIQWPFGAISARWEPQWTGGEIDPALPAINRSPFVADDLRGTHHAFARQAARYLIALGLLSDATPSPLRIEFDKHDRKVRHVYLVS